VSLFELSYSIPRPLFGQVLQKLGPEGLKASDGPLARIGHRVVETYMPALFNSHGHGTWPPPLRGGYPLWDTGMLAKGFHWGFDGDAAIKITNTGKPPKIVAALDGMGKAFTIIKPTSHQYLAIPLPTLVGRERFMKPREFQNTFVAMSRNGNLIIFQRTLGKTGKRAGKALRRRSAFASPWERGMTTQPVEDVLRPLFVLKTSVELPARPFMHVTPELMAECMDVVRLWLKGQFSGPRLNAA